MDEIHGETSKKDNRRRRKSRRGKCKVCGREFYAVKDYDTEKGKVYQKYCSKDCWSIRATIYNKCAYCGKQIKTTKSVNKKYCNRECWSEGYRYGTKEEANAWKGKEASYSAIHKWVNKHYDKPIKCEQCGSDKYIDWANKSGEHKRKRNDWIALCRSCHFYYDGRDKKFRRYK